MKITITTLEEFKSFVNTQNPPIKQGNIYIDGLTIERNDFLHLNLYHDPRVLHFNNCNFVGDDCFYGNFCCANGYYDFAITNSHLTSLQGVNILNGLNTVPLHYLDLSNNDFGKIIDDNRITFLKFFKDLFGYYFHLTSIVITNNGFSEAEKSDLLSLLKIILMILILSLYNY